MYTINILAPFLASLCFDNFVTKQGELCNFRDYPQHVVKYDAQSSEKSCYRNGVFYSRCKDLDNLEK